MPTANLGIVYVDGNMRQPEVAINAAFDVIDAAVHAAASPPRAHAYNNSAQSISNNSETVLGLTGELYDTDTIHDNVTNNSRLTCKTAGDYRISGGAGFAANATGARYLVIKINGVAKQYDVRNAVAGGVLGAVLNVPYTTSLIVGDYVEIFVFQDSGGSLNVTSCNLAMEKIG